MVDHVEGFREVDSHGGGAFSFGLVEALCHLVNNGQQGCGGGMSSEEAMLSRGEEEGVELRED